MNDTLQRFIFEHTPIRGEIVHLDATWRAVLERHNYPPIVRNLLGEMMAAAILLAATLKMRGRMIVQIQGHGPIRLLVVECTNALELRAVAHWQDLPESADLDVLLGDGRLIITLEPDDEQEKYQSVVETKGKTLSDVLRNYLQQSEQLDTHIWLAANSERAAGMLVQKLPSKDSAQDSDIWNRVIHLSATVQREELLQLPQLSLLHRLYHEEEVRVFDPSPTCFRCSCSKDRVNNMLRVLGYDEVKSILLEQGQINVACEFCNQKYIFDSVDAEQLFASVATPPTSDSKH